MSLFILDTDVLSLLQSRHPAVVANVAAHRQDQLAITIISVEEHKWRRRKLTLASRGAASADAFVGDSRLAAKRSSV